MKVLLFLLVCLTFNSLYGQSRYEQFRQLEGEVKYTNPDSLLHFSKTIDTTDITGKLIKKWALGRMHYWNLDFPESYKVLSNASNYLKLVKSPILSAELSLDIASSLILANHNGKAMSHLLNANRILSLYGDNKQKAKAAISLGELYRKTQDFDNALKTLHGTLSISKTNSYNHSRCLNRIAAVHSELGNLDSSFHYSLQAKEIAENINESHLIATAANEMGYVLAKKNKLDSALAQFHKADSLWRTIGMYRYAVNAMNHISVYYGVKRMPKKSLEITYQALQLIKNKDWHHIEMKIYDDLRNLYHGLGYKDSAQHYEILRLNSVVKWQRAEYEINTKMVENLFKQKEYEVKISEQSVQLENTRLEKQAIANSQQYLIIFVVIILLALLSIFFYTFKLKRLKRSFEEKNLQEELKNKQLENALTVNEALVKEVSHRVKNNLAMLSGLLNIQSEKTNNKEVKNEIQEAMLRVDSIASIHKRLYSDSEDTLVDLNKAVEDLCNNIFLALGRESSNELDLSLEKCETNISKSVIFCLIINEVLTNVCKYGDFDDSNPLKIKLRKSNSEIVFSIKEYGKGFNLEEKINKNESLGLYLIETLSRQLKANYFYEKSKDTFNFTLKFQNV